MRNITLVIACVLVLLQLTGCSLRKDAPSAPSAAQPAAEAAAVGLPNPMRESSMEELYEIYGVELKAPSDAEDVAYFRFEGEEPLGQMSFTRGGVSCCCRVAAGDALRDISGMYYDWETVVLVPERNLSLSYIPSGAGIAAAFDEADGRILSLSVSDGADEALLRAVFDEVFGAPVGEADGLAAQLCEQLDQLRSVCFPGTAGSSLSFAASAAEMADFFYTSGIAPDSVDRIVRSYRASLSEADAELFEMQLDGIVGAYGNLTGDGGRGLLEDCGYESSCYPWDAENVRNCFVALLGTD